MIIDGRKIGEKHPPYVIAELSANHNHSIDTAFELIDAAKKAGADAVKIQTYTADTLTLNSRNEEFMITSGLWKGQTLYELYKLAHLPWDWHKPIFEKARKSAITIFSSPFDKTAVDLLEDLNTPAYKIASFEIVDLPLIKYAASTGKPMIISTGLANFLEIEEAIDTALSSGCKELAVLHCVSGYPAPYEDCNLRTLTDIRSRFDLVTGLSDHTLDNTSAIASVALGASIVEKHFTLNRSGGGPDDSFSLEPDGLLDLCTCLRKTWESLGKIDYTLKESEKQSLIFRRSLYFVNNLQKGDPISESCIRSVRPGLGIPPKHIDELVGKRVNKNIAKNTPVNWNDVD